MLKKLMLAVTVTAILLTGACGSDSTSSDDSAAAPMFNLEVTTAAGTTDTLASYEGQPMVINFFAAWCPPCRREMPDFEEAAQANLGDVAFVGISHDLDETTWKSLIEETGVTFDTYFQPEQEIFNSVGASVMPTTLFVTADGEVAKLFAGALTAERIQELIDELLV